jgi:hypothetical protein
MPAHLILLDLIILIILWGGIRLTIVWFAARKLYFNIRYMRLYRIPLIRGFENFCVIFEVLVPLSLESATFFGCDAVYFGRSSAIFRRNVIAPSLQLSRELVSIHRLTPIPTCSLGLYSLKLKMEAVSSSETSISFYQIAQCHISEHHNFFFFIYFFLFLLCCLFCFRV